MYKTERKLLKTWIVWLALSVSAFTVEKEENPTDTLSPPACKYPEQPYTPKRLIYVGPHPDPTVDIVLYREENDPQPFWKRIGVFFPYNDRTHSSPAQKQRPQVTPLGMFVINSYNSTCLFGDTINVNDLMAFEIKGMIYKNEMNFEETRH
ncbi:MAG: hypothetical protein K2Y18_02320 [Alphaproteobacteria bacterium]|jgi:hypothetical protein|nr:hypothetical protein [Alphaproteobacteria bacterium]